MIFIRASIKIPRGLKQANRNKVEAKGGTRKLRATFVAGSKSNHFFYTGSFLAGTCKLLVRYVVDANKVSDAIELDHGRPKLLFRIRGIQNKI